MPNKFGGWARHIISESDTSSLINSAVLTERLNSRMVGKQEVRNLGSEFRLALYGGKSFASQRMFCGFQAMSLRRILNMVLFPSSASTSV